MVHTVRSVDHPEVSRFQSRWRCSFLNLCIFCSDRSAALQNFVPEIKNRNKNIKWCAPCVPLILRRFHVFSHVGCISPLTCAILVPIGVKLLFNFCTSSKIQKFNIQWCALCAPLILRRFHEFSHVGGVAPSLSAILVPIGVKLLFNFSTKAQKYEHLTFNGAHRAHH